MDGSPPQDPLRFQQARDIMVRFSTRTGIVPPAPPRRYLWTDAFAVCNYLGLAEFADPERFVGLAVSLADQVHQVLGRHRPDDSRSGWISGLPEKEAAAHPTIGGLRIGKPLPERGSRQALDPDLEWERDGQYFHYLTKWMHALHLLFRWSGEARWSVWARELAASAHAAFAWTPFPGAPRRMIWKMSIDLTRPLVPSMGQHDPLDGLITYRTLQTDLTGAEGPALDLEIADLSALAADRDWTTGDPLGIGGLLVDAWRLSQLPGRSASDRKLLGAVLESARAGLEHFLEQRPLDHPAERRLAFRELGLSIGLRAMLQLHALQGRDRRLLRDDAEAALVLEQIVKHAQVVERIESCWSEAAHQQASSWLAHEDINAVMLATSLVPRGFLGLASAESG